MDSITAVLMEITNRNPMCLMDLEKIRMDIEEIEEKQGTMSRAGIVKYAVMYMAASEKAGFGVDREQIIDWSIDYTK